MTTREATWYVLFESHTQGLLLDSLLRGEGLHTTIVPTPRILSKSCGMALSIRAEEVDAVRVVIEKGNISILEIACMERSIDPYRDQYC